MANDILGFRIDEAASVPRHHGSDEHLVDRASRESPVAQAKAGCVCDVRDAGPSQLFYLKVRDGQMPAVASQTSCIALIQQTSGKNASDAADLLGDMNRAAAAADHSVYREVGRIGYFLIEAIVGDDIYGDGVRWFDRSPSNGQPTGHAAKGAMRHTPAAENTENRTYTSRRPQRSSSLARSRPQRMATSKISPYGRNLSSQTGALLHAV